MILLLFLDISGGKFFLADQETTDKVKKHLKIRFYLFC